MSIEASNWARLQPIKGAGRKSTLRALGDYANEDAIAYPSHKRLAFDTGQSTASVRRDLVYLEDLGLISRIARHRPNGSQTSNYYQLHLDRTTPAQIEQGGALSVSTPPAQREHPAPSTVSTPDPLLEPSIEPSGKNDRDLDRPVKQRSAKTAGEPGSARTASRALPRSQFFDTKVERREQERKRRTSHATVAAGTVRDFPGAAAGALAGSPELLDAALELFADQPDVFLGLWSMLEAYGEPITRLEEWLPVSRKLIAQSSAALVAYEARFVAANKDGISSPFPYLKSLIANPSEKSIREASTRRQARTAEARTPSGERLRNRE